MRGVSNKHCLLTFFINFNDILLSEGLKYKKEIKVSTIAAHTVVCPTADPGTARSIPAQSHTFVKIDHEIIS